MAFEHHDPRSTPGGPGSDGAQAILAFLAVFETPDFTPGVEQGGEYDGTGVITWPWIDYSRDVLAFVQALYDHGWVVSFDWGSWQDEAEQILAGDGVERADVETLRRLLTLISRKDRFCEGFLATAFESGWIVRILRRLNRLDREARASLN